MLNTLALFLAAAVFAVTIFKRLGLGPVLGYLVAGALIGPSGFGLVHEVEDTLHFAELGVVLLLFLIGLELQPSRLWAMRGAVFGLGGAQVGVTSLVICLIALLFHVPLASAAIVGVALAMSSTAFATQILGEKNELGVAHGRAAFGILLFQDVAAIPALAIVPLLGASQAVSARNPYVQFAIGAGVIAALVIGGRHLLRPAFRLVAQARSQELSTASALLVVMGTALLMHSIGLSMALGAFIAGVLLADSEYRHELEADIEPFKGLLLGLFFMAVGMSANLRVLLVRPVAVTVIVVGIVAVKFAVLYGLGRLTKLSRRSSASLGVAISQGGEFAFVIFAAAVAARAMEGSLSELLVVAVTLSMVLTPLLFMARDAFDKWREANGAKREYDEIKTDDTRVIIAGFGRFGQIVARVLRLKGIPFTALDASATHVDFVRKFGNKIHYGDASRVDLLRAAHADRAEVFVLAIDDFEASMKTLATVQHHFPNLKIVARARNRQHAYALLGAGVEDVIRETFAGSIEASRLTLEELGLPSSEARSAVKIFADYDEEAVRKTYIHRDDPQKLVESSKAYSAELERIFQQDEEEKVA